ncbi:glycosyltransferase [Alloacidobacterium dinghuense]|uniref:glycosyltransferase n=1 Tax=Alloacidobacterium dinghuense TaxID=2763107 RepID=UPI00203704B5|nr:glycosyltransferase family 2 protein [Alloacidobacterium dinghuense]
MNLSVIIPARNEEDGVGACLESLVAQSDEGWKLGRDWELLVVDDGSTDRTREIASGFEGVTVILPDERPKNWTGKANAAWTAAKLAKGEWLLFTDADTVHEAGDLRRALHEAEKHKVAMLSYSPKQIVAGFWQRALMPLVFSELALAYPPAKVSDPESRLAGANGQFLLVKGDAYMQVGGHQAVAESMLEDVDLAYLVKRRKLGLRFRYAPDALSTRMYRSFGQMCEGWTKNLALLFGNTLITAGWKLLDIFLLAGLPVLAWYFPGPLSVSTPWITARLVILLIWLRTLWRFYRRVAKSNFPLGDCLLSVFGLPLFVWLLWKSWFDHTVTKRVVWKGREYAGGSR